MSLSSSRRHGAIGWMADNPVAANILMLFLLVGGLFWGLKIKQEVYPEFDLDQVTIAVAYPGASPDEVEQGIVLPIEKAIGQVEGVKEVRSTAREGSGSVVVEALIDTDVNQLALDIQNEVDRISTFPEDAEEPVVTVPVRRRGVITMILHSDVGEAGLRELGERVRDELLQDGLILQVELSGARPLEISIEVGEAVLRAHGLTLAEIANKVAAASLDLPGGAVKTQGGQILVRMKERRDLGREFGDVPILSGRDGGVLRLRDLAVIHDGFEETDQFMTYNGKTAIGIEVFRVGDQTPIKVADAVYKHVERLRKTLPEGVLVDTVDDRSEMYKQRLNLLLKNGYFGLILVFLLLGLFLEPRLAFWVTMGIPISFLGSLLILPFWDVSINMISLFAFIISLGIVVDDAIIIGENVYSHRQRGLVPLQAAMAGAREMAAPVTFSVLTNIVTFVPLYFVPGTMGKIFRVIPVVVASVFLISLVEALFVLPAHIGHQKPATRFRRLAAVQAAVSAWLAGMIRRVYTPLLVLALRFRYLSVAIGLSVLLLALGYARSGRMGMEMFPKVESDAAHVSAVLPVGVPVERSAQVGRRLLAAAEQVRDEIKAQGGRQVQGMLAEVDNNTVTIRVYLSPPEERPVSTDEFVKRWRKAAGPIAGLESIRFQSDFGGPGSGSSLSLELRHRDVAVLEQAATRLGEELALFPKVANIDNGFLPGKRQFDFSLKPAGYHLGLTPQGVAGQIRDAFHGHEVRRQLRGRNEVKIMVRLPEDERRAADAIERFIVRSPGGGEASLGDVVWVRPGHALTEIQHRDGRRVLTVSADVNPRSETDQVVESLRADVLPRLMAMYPGLSWSSEGRQADRHESMAALARGLGMALLLVYVLLAIPFRSYVQPVIIMSAIPFGIVGAIAGHLLMGYSLSIISMFGIVALSGVVVNDSLILIDMANRKHRDGQSGYAAVVNAATSRFRPIILTTLTTFFGLAPMILETSRQARFLIPMAISLGFGILFATGITLVLIPSLYLILEDAKRLLARIRRLLP